MSVDARLVLLVLVLASGAAASEPEAPSPPPEAAPAPLVVEGTELVAEIQAARAETERLRALQTEAQGDDAAAIQRQREELGLAYMRLTGLFVDNVLAREKAGIDVSADRAFAARELLPLGPRIEAVIREAAADSQALRERRPEVVDAGLSNLEERLAGREAWLDKAYAALLGHVGNLERLGFDANRSRGFLTEMLPQRATLLGGRIRIGRERVSALQQELELDPSNAKVAGELRAERRRLDVATESLRSCIALMSDLKLDTAKHQKLLIETTGEVTTALLDRDVAVSLLRDWWEHLRAWVQKATPGVVVRVVRAGLVLLLFWVLAGITRRIVRLVVRSSRFQTSQLLQTILMSLAARTVLLFGMLLALSQLGVQITALLAGLGIAGFIVGFALQNTLSNFAAGGMILVYRPFDVGDVVEAGGVFGKVDSMSLVSTTLLTFDNQTLIVPNNKIWGDVITNLTHQGIRRVDLSVRVGYGEDVERVEAILREVVAKHPKTLDDPEPLIKVNELGESSVQFAVRPWTRTDGYWEVRWDLQREILVRLRREGIEVPVRQHVSVHAAAPELPGS